MEPISLKLLRCLFGVLEGFFWFGFKILGLGFFAFVLNLGVLGFITMTYVHVRETWRV